MAPGLTVPHNMVRSSPSSLLMAIENEFTRQDASISAPVSPSFRVPGPNLGMIGVLSGFADAVGPGEFVGRQVGAVGHLQEHGSGVGDAAVEGRLGLPQELA